MFPCAECGTPIGKGASEAAYDHTIHCLRTPTVGHLELLRQFQQPANENQQRVVSNLQRALAEDNEKPAPQTADNNAQEGQPQ